MYNLVRMGIRKFNMVKLNFIYIFKVRSNVSIWFIFIKEINDVEYDISKIVWGMGIILVNLYF